MRIIFLDFDGVITTRRTKYRYGDEIAIKALNYIVKKTEAVVVVSSSWRYEGLYACKNHLLRWGFKGAVMGLTPQLDINATRGEEIDAWLKDFMKGFNNPFIPNFVVLDDDSDIEPWEDRWVRTKVTHGLNMIQAEKAVEILKR